MTNHLQNLKHFALVAVVFALLTVIPGRKAWGQIMVEEFNYTAGTLLTANGWTAHSGTGTNSITVAASTITYTGYVSSGIGNEVTMTTSGEDVNKAFASQNSGSLYASFIVNVTSSQANGDYFAHFAAQSGSTGVTTFAGRVWVKKDASTTSFAFGISKSSTTANIAYTGFNYTPGTTYLVVVRYNFVTGVTNDDAALFINPVLNTTEPVPTLTTLLADNGTTDPAQLLSYCLRQGSSGNAPVLKLDGIRVGLTWSEVVNGSITAPTLQATNVTFANVTSSGLTASWTNGNGSSRAVFMKQGNSGSASPSNNTTYTASATFGSGTEIGSSGWFCIFNGAGTTVNVTGLTPSTDYIVMVCEYNGSAGGEQYNTSTATGNPNTQTTSSAGTPTLTTTTLNGFGNVCILATAGPENFTINGTNLTTADVTVAALDGFSYCTTAGGTYTSSLTLTQPGGTYSQVIYVKFSPLLVQSYNGDIVVGGGSASPVNAAATGSGVNTAPAVTTTTPATSVTEFGATCSGEVTAAGCQSITGRGICYGTSASPTIAGTHTVEPGTTGIFSSNITGLIPNTTYHFRAYATSSAGTSYGTDQTFTTLNLTAPVATAATNISSAGFTANWGDVSGASGYYLDVYTTSAGSYATDLFISEYVEGSSNNKYLEIFNGTGAVVDLTGYKIQLFTNGGTVPTNTEVLSGTLFPGALLVFKNSAAALTLPPGVTATVSSTCNFNGDDAIALVKGTTPTYVDIFGRIGEDPGSAWISGTYTTLDKTLRKKSTVLSGVTINPSSGFPTLETEWDQYDIDNVSDLGSHTFSGATNTYILANYDVGNVTSFNVTGLNPGTLYHYVVRAYYSTASSPSSNVIDVTTNPSALLTVSTEVPTAISSSTATGNGTIITIGSPAPTARGFCWDLASNPDPDILDSKVEETGTFSTGSFTGNITGLTPATLYKIRAYATDAAGTAYGDVVTIYTLSVEPTNHAASFSATATSQTEIDLAFSAASTITNAAGYLILQRIDAAPTGIPADGTGYSVGNVIGDGTVAAIISDINATSAAITGLTAGTHYFYTLFPYNWDGVVAATYNYKTDGTVPSANATTNAPLDATSEVSGPALGLQPNPVVISSLATTDATAVRVFDMKIYDYATSDAEPTKITQVTIKAGPNNTADWANTIYGIKLSIDGGISFVTIGTPTFTASSIVVPVTSGNLNIPNGGVKTLSLYVYLKSSGLTDNQILEFKVDAAALSHGFMADPTGSTFLSTFINAPVSNQVRIDVIATKLKFVQQPTNALVNVAMSPPVTIEATDANNNRDLNTTGIVNLVSSGTMTGPVTASIIDGLGTFGSIVHTAAGTGLTLTASFSGLSDAVSNTFNITLVPTLTELIVPLYMGSKTAASTNNARASLAFCIRIDNLQPSTAYDLRFGLGITSDVATSYGAGNVWKPVDGYAGSPTNTIPNAFTTNASGSSGPVWVIFQPTGNGTRFDAGQVHNLRIGYAVNGTTMPSSPNFVGTKTITALDIAATARTTSTTDDGAFIKGSADPVRTGNYVLLFDNVAGTGNPLFSYQIRQATATSGHQSELPNPVDSVYMQSGSSAIGDYPAVIPIGANNPNGVQRVEGRYADNTISGYNTDADGIWPSGVNTTALARREVGRITVTDAPLVPVNKTLNVKVYLEGLYNTGTGFMNEAQGTSGPEFGAGIADKVTIELHDATSPYAVAYIYSDISLNTDGTLTISTVPAAVTGSYYLVVKNRNHLETWSAAPVSFSGAGPFAYNFSTAASQAYGSNMKLMGTAYTIWAGDISQDGLVDGSDMAAVDNASTLVLTGYNVEDANGDGLVDGSDMAIIDNNSTLIIAVVKP